MCQANNHGWRSISRLHHLVKSHYFPIITHLVGVIGHVLSHIPVLLYWLMLIIIDQFISLSFVSKLVERVVEKQLCDHLEAHGFENQFAYKAGHFTETALLLIKK